jgi:hypothetical protein
VDCGFGEVKLLVETELGETEVFVEAEIAENEILEMFKVISSVYYYLDWLV